MYQMENKTDKPTFNEYPYHKKQRTDKKMEITEALSIIESLFDNFPEETKAVPVVSLEVGRILGESIYSDKSTDNDDKEWSNKPIFQKGSKLDCFQIGLLNAFGYSDVEINRRPRVCVLSIDKSQFNQENDIPCDQITTNRPLLLSLFKSQGFKPVDGGSCVETDNSIISGVLEAAKFSDVITISNTTNPNSRCFVRDVLAKMLNFIVVINFNEINAIPMDECCIMKGDIDGMPRIVFILPSEIKSNWICANIIVSPFMRLKSGIPKQCARPRIMKARLTHNFSLTKYPQYKHGWMEIRSNGLLYAFVANTTEATYGINTNVILCFPSDNSINELTEESSIDIILVNEF